jgi:predicted Zn-dependent peptidase
MLNDGTSELTSTEIADKIDYYGAFLQTEYANDHSTVTLFTLNKHLANTLPIVKSIVSDSIFPQVELDTLIRNQKQKLSVSLEKNDFLSRKTFSHVLFGDTLYGYDIAAADYEVSINRTHADFPGLQVVNTIFGGYFGSRLMANIREDKGYTYGIGSALVSMKNTGYFFIASEVGADVCTSALAEIEKEITILKEQPVTEGELALVRNYMLGSMLGSLENALSHADKFKNIYFSGLDYDYYKNYINKVRNIGPEEIQSLANKYLNFNSFEKVIVGKK